MKDCPRCDARLFDDQVFCYECMMPVLDVLEALPAPDDPSETMVCIEVAVGESFCYETRFRKEEGVSISVGSARENAIVIPFPEMCAHQLDIFFSQGHLWAEEKETRPLFQLNGVPFNGTRNLRPGAVLEACNARLTVVSA